MRVCSEDIFPMYFQMNLPEGAISNAEMQAFLSISADEEAIRARLRQLATEKRPDGITRIRPILDRLQDYTRTMVSRDQAMSIISALLIEGDDLLVAEDEPNIMFSFGTDVSISRVIYQLLQVLNENDRFEVFQSAIERSTSIRTVVNEISKIERFGRKPLSSEVELISESHSRELTAQGLEMIKGAATEGRLIDLPRPLMYLYRWRDWGDIDDARAWVGEQISSDGGMLNFLTKTKNKIISGGENKGESNVRFEIQIQEIEPFVDVQDLATRAAVVLESSRELSDEQRATLVELIEKVVTPADDVT